MSGLQEQPRAAQGEGDRGGQGYRREPPGPAQEAAESVKSTAAEGVENVKAEGQSAKDQVQGQAQESKDRVKEHAS